MVHVAFDSQPLHLNTHPFMLIQLTYASRAVNLGPADIKDILAASNRNNARLGITGALCLNNGVFLQQLEGDRETVSALYHRILLDKRHQDTCLLDFGEIPHRRFTGWSMGLLSSVEENRKIFLKYASSAEFDPYSMRASTLHAFFDEVVGNVRWLS
jgi:Sensors of blue-light using FAD